MTTQPSGLVPEFSQADRFRKAREVAGYEQAELADVIGVSRGTVSNVERGTVGVRRITVNAWALATGVDRAWLETGQAPAGPGPDGARSEGFEPPTFWLGVVAA